jgi:hypothetical protein
MDMLVEAPMKIELLNGLVIETAGGPGTVNTAFELVADPKILVTTT